MWGLEIIVNYPGPWLCWVLPLIGAVLMPLFGRMGDKIRDYMAVAFVGSSVISTVSMIPYLLSGDMPGDIKLGTWFSLPGGNPLSVGVLVDPLSTIICVVVAFLSFLIAIFSLGYMSGERGLTRYWFFFLFFIGSMLLLVISDNFLQIIIGWEGVGVCSYGLIGFYYRDAHERWIGGPPPIDPPSMCGMKAFLMTGIGDAFLLLAIFILFHFTGTLNLIDIMSSAPKWMASISSTPGLLALTAFFFLGGPIGKSAQFPLHEWLPEAMAGPTPVSALIHAATMVKAGVYLVARMSPMFYVGYWIHGFQEAQVFFIVIAFVGAFTAFLAASQAIVNIELKKILAYSTVSQIGYMMLGLGVSGLSEGSLVAGLTSAVFHLTSHGLFKAALFLCAGAIIHSVGSIYISNMGGLKKHMYKIYWLMVVATLSLSGIPPLSGFWSKDSVFLASIIAGTPYSLLLLGVGAISAAMTFAYSIRYIIKTFHGEESEFIHELEKEGYHIHEAPILMWGPIAILVVIVIIVGFFGLVGVFNPHLSPEIFIEEQMHNMLNNILPHEVELHLSHPNVSNKLMAVGISASMLLVGGLAGWIFYLSRRLDPWKIVTGNSVLKGIHTFLWNRWYLNPFYNLIVDLLISFSNNVFGSFETGVVDSGLNIGVPLIFTKTYHRVKKIQTGLLNINIYYIVLTFLGLLLFGLLFYGGL